ncbi:hypothetical protein BDV06DRAFT_187237 [Aspergillus oleicola]
MLWADQNNRLPLLLDCPCGRTNCFRVPGAKGCATSTLLVLYLSSFSFSGISRCEMCPWVICSCTANWLEGAASDVGGHAAGCRHTKIWTNMQICTRGDRSAMKARTVYLILLQSTTARRVVGQVGWKG